MQFLGFLTWLSHTKCSRIQRMSIHGYTVFHLPTYHSKVVMTHGKAAHKSSFFSKEEVLDSLNKI